jgi:hypothetical protein
VRRIFENAVSRCSLREHYGLRLIVHFRCYRNVNYILATSGKGLLRPSDSSQQCLASDCFASSCRFQSGDVNFVPRTSSESLSRW